MQFGIGFVVGGLVAGVIVAKSGSILKALHQFLSKALAAIEGKLSAGAADLKSKL